MSAVLPPVAGGAPALPLAEHATKTTIALLTSFEALLAGHPAWRAPSLSPSGALVLHPSNEVSAQLYGSSRIAARDWRQHLVPGALALEALSGQQAVLPLIGTPLDHQTALVFRHCLDAVGVRERGALMLDLLRILDTNRSGRPQRWVSLAGGAARPVLEALVAVRAEVPGFDATVELVDLDQRSLDYAATVASELGLPHSIVRGHRRDLIRGMVAGDAIVRELGAGTADVVDLLGFLEYCSEAAAVRLLRNAVRLVRPGGVLVTSNMLSDRPQRHLHERGIGWPGVRMRSLPRVRALLESAAPHVDVAVHVVPSATYAVLIGR